MPKAERSIHLRIYNIALAAATVGTGSPEKRISTSMVERQNLTMLMKARSKMMEAPNRWSQAPFSPES